MSRPESVQRLRNREPGQALVEFALVIFMFIAVVAAIIQLGLVLWTQNTITQIARDTARWAVVQSSPCGDNRSALANAANTLATQRALMNYAPGSWSSAPSIGSLGASGVGADWQSPDSTFMQDCPPSDNQMTWTVRVRVNHVVPVFFPGFGLVGPSCGSPGWCISSETELRMEPKKR